MDQPSESKGPKEEAEEISHEPHKGPEGINAYEEAVKIKEGNLRKKETDDPNGDQAGKDKSLQKEGSSLSRIPINMSFNSILKKRQEMKAGG